jgi:DNA-binding CsgD family transcriptional regulator/Flp pilus assembly protein TadD
MDQVQMESHQPMPPSAALEQGRDAFRQRRWTEALRLLEAAEERSPLSPADYESLAMVRYLLSTDNSGLGVMEEAHRTFVARGDVRRAAKVAYSLGMNLVSRGENATGRGWIARAGRLLDDAELDCPERGYLLMPTAIQAAQAGDLETAVGIFREAIRIGKRFGDNDLVTLARQGEGRTLLRAGPGEAGFAIIDEVMVSVTSGDVSPVVVGIIYCSVIETLHEVYDLRRARDWTAAMERWCAGQPELALYRGECMVYRAHTLQIGGEWEKAHEELAKACSRFLGPPPHPAAGEAFYQEGELHRLTGRIAEAEAAYVQAGTLGRNPQPGLALLRIAQGRRDSAYTTIKRVLSESHSPMQLAAILPAFVDIAIESGDLERARSAASELAGIAAETGSLYLCGLASEATGAALLAIGEIPAALQELRGARRIWQELEAVHHGAQVRLLIGVACRRLGDEDSARLELDNARQVFTQLGANPDVARIDELERKRSRDRVGGLTGREVELLNLLATGKTNREIAQDLVISEKTVARHVSNIFNKIGVSSRAAATAYAYRHDLV